MAEDGGYIKVTNSLVESIYLYVLGPQYVLNFIYGDLVIRVKTVDMMNHYEVRNW